MKKILSINLALTLAAVLLFGAVQISRAALPEGPEGSTHPHPTNSNWYYQIENGFAILKECPGGLVFDPITGHCEWPQ